MDRSTKEILAIEETIRQAGEEQVQELNDLQLALVGGGSGDTIMH